MSVVILPAYQPDECLVFLTDQLRIPGNKIIVVDDGSGISYRPVFDRLNQDCIVLRHRENRGKGAAVKTALAYIKHEGWDNEVIGVMDSDGQHLAEDMYRLLESAGIHRKTLVLGVRSVGKEMPLKSRLGNRITRTVFRIASGKKVSDTQTGLRAFNAELINDLLLVKGERYEYEMNVLMTFAKAGISIEEVPVSTIYHDSANSCSHFRAVWDSVRIYKDILKFTFSSFSGFVLDYLLFALLMAFLPPAAMCVLAANVLARVVSAFYNYGINCRFVFHTDRKAKTAAEYFVLAVFILTMNNVCLELLVQVLRLSVYPAKLATECVLFIVSWLIQKFVIFGKKKPDAYKTAFGNAEKWTVKMER